MYEVDVKKLIITCEACGNVKKFQVQNESDSEKIFEGFTCENNCGKNLCSYISVGSLKPSAY